MKFQVAFLVLSIVAVAFAASAGSVESSKTALVPWTGCGSGNLGGLIGLLQQILCLLGNILANIIAILRACDGRLDGTVILAILRNLIGQIYAIIIILLGGTGLTNAQCTFYQTSLAGLIAQIVAIIDNLLGAGVGYGYCCTNPLGFVGWLIAVLINIVLSFLTGACGHDCGFLGSVFNLCLSLCQSCITSLV